MCGRPTKGHTSGLANMHTKRHTNRHTEKARASPGLLTSDERFLLVRYVTWFVYPVCLEPHPGE